MNKFKYESCLKILIYPNQMLKIGVTIKKKWTTLKRLKIGNHKKMCNFSISLRKPHFNPELLNKTISFYHWSETHCITTFFKTIETNYKNCKYVYNLFYILN